MYSKEFCADGLLVNPKCYTLETYDFASEEQIFDILLDVLKSELPNRLKNVMDCNDNPMYISEEHIDLIPADTPGNLELILNPLSDAPNYSDSLMYRTVDYSFELILTVRNKKAHCITWELLRFKNAIEGLIVGAEFAIDGYDSVTITPRGFSYIIPEQDAGIYLRQGAYRFTVTVTQYRTDIN